MFMLMAENVTVGLLIVFATLVMYGLWALTNDPIPGDQEKQMLIRHMKEMNAQSQQQARAILAEVAGRMEQNCRREHAREKTKIKDISA